MHTSTWWKSNRLGRIVDLGLLNQFPKNQRILVARLRDLGKWSFCVLECNNGVWSVWGELRKKMLCPFYISAPNGHISDRCTSRNTGTTACGTARAVLPLGQYYRWSTSSTTACSFRSIADFGRWRPENFSEKSTQNCSTTAWWYRSGSTTACTWAVLPLSLFWFLLNDSAMIQTLFPLIIEYVCI